MDKVDVIIVGAGLAGLSCAYELASPDMSILVLERGDFPGSKNITGGRLYLRPIIPYISDLWKDAPFERHVVKERFTFMGEDNSVTFELYSDRFNETPHPSYTILRANFDRWLAEKVSEKGAFVITQKRVDELIIEDGKVIGVRTDGEEIGSDCVVAADGILSFLAEKAGLRGPFKPNHFAIGFKEIIKMDSKAIEDRFALADEEGAAQLFIGSITKGMIGGGFLYTNRESLSLGLVIGLDSLNSKSPREEVYKLLDQFKERPEIKNLVKGGEVIEYSAHLINESGVYGMPKLYTDGMLLVGDAAGLGLNMLFTVRGMEYAIVSGILAAKTIKEAKKRNDFSKASLSEYEKLLNESFIMKEMHAFKNVPVVLNNKRLFKKYPQAISDIFEDLMWVDEKPKQGIYKTKMRRLKKEFFDLQTLRDFLLFRKI